MRAYDVIESQARLEINVRNARDTCGEARYLILFNGEIRSLVRKENGALARRAPSINRR